MEKNSLIPNDLKSRIIKASSKVRVGVTLDEEISLGLGNDSFVGSKQNCRAWDSVTHTCKPSHGSHQKFLPPTCFLKLTGAIFL